MRRDAVGVVRFDPSHQRIQAGVRTNPAAGAVHEAAKVLAGLERVACVRLQGGEQAASTLVCDGSGQSVSRLDVVVHRRRLDAELTRNSGDAKRVDAVLLHDLDRRVDERLGGQRWTLPTPQAQTPSRTQR